MNRLCNQIAQKLVADGVATDIAAAVTSLTGFFKDEVCVRWTIKDAALAANNAGRVVTHKEAREVLDFALQNHDCENGFNWRYLEEIASGFGRPMIDEERVKHGEDGETFFAD